MNKYHIIATSTALAVLLVIGLFLPPVVSVQTSGVATGNTIIADNPIVTGETQALATPHEPGEEVIELRGEISKTYYLGDGSYRYETGGGIQHYKDDPDDPDELWKDVDTTIVASSKDNWDWEVVTGNWHLLIREDTTVAFGKSGHWIGFRYGGFGYLDWDTKEYEILQTRQAVTPVVGNNTITWDGIFGAGTSLEYVYTTNGLKENIYIEQSARNWLVNNPPSSFGLSNGSSYLVGYLECDWKSSYPAETVDGTPINWNNINEFINSGVFWRHPTLGKIVTALPIGWAEHDDVDPEEWVKLRYRFYKHTNGTHYLLFGAKVLDLNAYPDGTIVLDPTLTVQPGSKDTYISSCYDTTIYGTETLFRVGYSAALDDIRRSILEFSISALPSGAEISSAVMLLYIEAITGSDTYTAYRMLRTDWEEGEATWNVYKIGSNWGTAGCGSTTTDYTTTDSVGITIDSSKNWESWTITNQVKTAQSSSIPVEVLVRGGTTSGAANRHWYTWSREYTTDTTLRPKLVIEYTHIPDVTTNAVSDETSDSLKANAEVDDAYGEDITRRGFQYYESGVHEDDFEWGSDGDDIDDSGGDITWSKSVAGTSTAKISTDEAHSGTRSLELYRDGSNSPRAYFSQTAGDYIVSMRVMRKSNSTWSLYHGDGSNIIWLRISISDGEIYGHDGTNFYYSGVYAPLDQWGLVEVDNIRWATAEYDVWYNGILILEDVPMRPTPSWANTVNFYNTGGTSYCYVDDVYVWDVEDESGTWSEGTFSLTISGLDPATSYRIRAFAESSVGIGYGATVTGLTTPAAPTNVQATDGDHTDKVVVTWTKSTGATDYKVYEGSNLLDTLGDVDSYDDTAAPAPTITPGSTVASDGASTAHVALSLSGTSTSNGASRTYKVVAFNDSGDSPDSDTDTGYRGVGALTYQWQRSAADSNASYSDIVGATSSTHNDTDAPQGTVTPGTVTATDGASALHVALSIAGQSANDGEGRYYQCILNADGAAQQTTASDRGYRTVGALTYQWQRSAADSDASYSNIVGATSDTYNDTDAPAPTVTAGNATATDGTHCDNVTLNVIGHSGNDGDGRYWRCVLSADGADSQESAVDRGYRGTDTLTFQWQESAADSDAAYSNITGATVNPYDHTDGVRDPDGRYYQAVVSMTGAASQNSTADRGYREAIAIPTVVSYNATGIANTAATLHGEITDINCENATIRGFEWGLSSGNYTDDWSENGSFGLGTFDRQITGLPVNTQIFWRAFAENTAGRGYSGERSFTTLDLLEAPTNFTITQIGPTSINITWTMGIGATGTEIRISEDGYPETVTDDYLAYNGTGTYVVIDGLTLSSITYYFRAWSYNIADYSADYAQAQIGGETMIFILFGILGLGFTFGFFWKRSGFFAYGASGIWALLGFLALQHSAGTNPTQIVDVYMGLFWLCVGFTIACGLLPSLMKEKPTVDDPCPMDALGDDISSYVALRKKVSK